MKQGIKFQRVEISDKEYQTFKNIETTIRSNKVFKRVQAFKLMYKDWKYSEIAEFLSVTNNTITNWIKLYKSGGIGKLLNLSYLGGQARLTDNQLVELKEESAKGNFRFAKDMKSWSWLHIG